MVEGCFWDWRPVANCVPQGLVLGPLLFVIYVNDLDENIEGVVGKYVDDTKIAGIVDSEEGFLRLQGDLDQMGQWAEKQQMEFNLDKCEALHFGTTNKGRAYTINGMTLGRVVEQRDLGVQ
eukprot:g22134.t1